MTDGADTQPAAPAYIERREKCPRYIFGGGVWIVLADSAQTTGNITNVESIYQRGGGLPALAHRNASEMAYVIAGRLRVRIGDEPETTADPGAMVFVPPGVARSFRADTDGTRVYHGFVPAGFDELIAAHGTATDVLSVPIDTAPLDAASANDYGIDLKG